MIRPVKARAECDEFWVSQFCGWGYHRYPHNPVLLRCEETTQNPARRLGWRLTKTRLAVIDISEHNVSPEVDAM